MKKYIIIFLLFILVVLSQVISIHNRNIERRKIINNKKDIDKLIEIGFDDEAEKRIDRFKSVDNQMLLMKIAISKGNLYNALEIAEKNNIFDAYPEYIFTLSEAFYNKGQFNKAHRIILENKVNDEELNKKIEDLNIKVLSEVRITEVDFEVIEDWNGTGENMIVVYNSGKYIVDEDGNINANRYDEIIEENGKYIATFNKIKFRLKPNGKFDSFLDSEDEKEYSAEVVKSEEGKSEEGNEKIDFSIIKKTENTGLFGYSYKNYEIVKPEYTMATSINKKGVGFIKAEDKWYKIQFLAFMDY